MTSNPNRAGSPSLGSRFHERDSARDVVEEIGFVDRHDYGSDRRCLPAGVGVFVAEREEVDQRTRLDCLRVADQAGRQVELKVPGRRAPSVRGPRASIGRSG